MIKKRKIIIVWVAGLPCRWGGLFLKKVYLKNNIFVKHEGKKYKIIPSDPPIKGKLNFFMTVKHAILCQQDFK